MSICFGVCLHTEFLFYKTQTSVLPGGSAANPTERGLNIPVDMAFAFHSDAGTTLNDSIIVTLQR